MKGVWPCERVWLPRLAHYSKEEERRWEEEEEEEWKEEEEEENEEEALLDPEMSTETTSP